MLIYCIFSILLLPQCASFSSSRFDSMHMTLQGRSSFLGDTDKIYLQSCLRLSIDSCKKCLSDKKSLIEVEFPASRKSDISVAETLDLTRAFVRELVDAWNQLKNELWVVFPDANELAIARTSKLWGEKIEYTMTSIEGAINAEDKSCKLLIILNPGFNVEEWINIPRIAAKRDAPMIIVNGNLDRVVTTTLI